MLFSRRQIMRATLGLAGIPLMNYSKTAEAADLCRDDVAIDTTTALVFPAQAALTPAPGHRDARAVWSRVLPHPDSTVLIYLHGHNNYVTVDSQGRSRVPDWATDDSLARAGASAKPAAPLVYGLDRLESQHPHKAPVVLVPEDSTLAKGDFWAIEPRGQYQDPARLGRLVADSFAHLACLHRSDGHPFQPAHLTSVSLKRAYLCGHSGAGLPLQEAAASDFVLPSTGVPTDLWLFDCTYWSEIANFVQFCARWHGVGRLAGGQPHASRFLCIYRPQTQTEEVADILRAEIAQVLGVSPDSLVKDQRSDNFTTEIKPILQNAGVLFLRTDLPHDEIPTFYIPRLLETAAL